MRPLFLASLFAVFCGAIAGWSVAGLVPPAPLPQEPTLRQEDYRLVRKSDAPLEITDGKWLQVPWLYADFDLSMDVELGEGMDLDLLVRQVEPRLVQNRIEPFHGRFSVLRLSTVRDGPAWRSRDEALFGPRGGGAELAAGYTATVWMQGRGRLLRANIAGKWQPWFEAADEYGMFTLVARGGKAVLRSLVIEHRGQPRAWLWTRWTWIGLGGLGGLLLAAVAMAVGERARTLAVRGVAGAAAAAAFASCPVDALALPSPGAMLQLLAAAMAVALAGMQVARLALVVFAVLCVASARPQLHTDPRPLDAVFGPAAGNTVSEAYAQLVRGKFELHNVAPAEGRVMLLGGQLLYDRGTPEEHLEPLLRGELRRELRRKVDVPCLPTVDGYTQQQWRLFTTFFTGYRPDVVVFGVPRDEAAFEHGRARSSPAQLAATLQAAQRYCHEHQVGLVLFTENDLPPGLMAVLRQAEAADAPLVVAGANEPPADLGRRLAAVVAPLLKAAARR